MPTVLIAVGPLSASARSTAEAIGFRDLAVVELATSLYGRTETEIAALARPAAGEAVRLLVR